MMALDYRSGDIVATTLLYTKPGICIRHEDIRLTLNEEGDNVSNVVGDVTVRYEKGKK